MTTNIIRRFNLGYGSVVAAIALIGAGCGAHSTPEKASSKAPTLPIQTQLIEPAPPLAEGTLAPGFTTKSIDGSSISLKALRGQVVLVDFWATWCGPCLMATPTIQSLNKQFGTKGLHVVGLSLDQADSRADIPKYKKRFHVTYSLAYDPDINIQASRDYNIWQDPNTGLPNDGPVPPAIFLIDRRGIVQWSQIGYNDEEPAELTQYIKRLLAEKA